MSRTIDIPFMPDPTPMEIPDDTATPPPPPAVPVRLPLARARAIAEKTVAALTPLCHRIEIAGSIRRQREFVGDIDLVILPKNRGEIVERIRKGCRIVTNGEQNLIAEWTLGDGQPFQLDLFFAREGKTELFDAIPSNWGTLLVCRTGSKDFNVFLCQRAQQLGLKWNPYQGVMSSEGKILAAEEEGDVFRELGFTEWIKPEDRER
jgi:DNA polymerase (family 10)